MQSPPPAADGRTSDLARYAVLLRTLNREMNRSTLDFAHEHKLHATDIHALSVIMDSPADEDRPVTPSRLREELRLTSGAVTACLDRLERAGHISRVRDSGDRRVVHIAYNPEARTLAREYFRPLARATEAARSRFDPGELATIAAFLGALNAELAAEHGTGE
ncbi:MarR family winged helix-turn-helix transcriptional regulator [Streptomyces griseus]|uniref:MarR family winged helix-turn-helix transcriptional regulator n=1 Tax=Streptomyces griseus TaxID=1911 RepID=UPI0004CA0A77|nr:MarR family winged helix-turn-helix transcriptional regulator [Streptomyces griseus]